MRTAAFLAAFLAIAGLVASEPAEAHGRSRVSIGLGFGYPYWGSPWGPWGPWGYPYPYYAAPVVVQQAPVTYIEQNSSAPSAPAADSGWWYYCDQSRGYYPYVRECATGWQRVPPKPAGQ